MKKYLITEDEVTKLSEALDAIGVVHGLRNLKPIEPLSYKQISQLWSDAHNDTSDHMAYQVMARAIERHILESDE